MYWAGGREQTTLQTSAEDKQQQNQELKPAASEARHTEPITRVLPEPCLQAGTESVKERIVHAATQRSWLLPGQQQGCGGGPAASLLPAAHQPLGFACVKAKQTGALSTASWNNCTSNVHFAI